MNKEDLPPALREGEAPPPVLEELPLQEAPDIPPPPPEPPAQLPPEPFLRRG